MPKERFKLIPEVYLLLIEGSNILLSRRFQTGYEDGNFSIIAGHVDGNETMREAIIREVKEEIGIDIDSEALEYFLTMHRFGNDERIGVYFTANKWRGDIENMEPNKCDDLSWFKIDQLPINTIPYIRHAIDCYKKGIKYSEFGWENNINH